MPGVTPVTTPVALTVATPGVPEFQVPPPAASASVTDNPVHTLVLPVIVPAEGLELIVTDAVALAVPQLLTTIYEMVVVPVVTPVTIPEATVAMPLFALDQVGRRRIGPRICGLL